MRFAKRILRTLGLGFCDLFSTTIRDCCTGEKLGRGLLVSLGGKILLIGYRGRALIPRFLPQVHLSFWKQAIGFTAQEQPDFASLSAPGTPVVQDVSGAKVLCILVTHRSGEDFGRLREWWSLRFPEDLLWVAFGGSAEEFASLPYPRKVFIDDPALRTDDHQREKQSYSGLLTAMVPVVKAENPDLVYLCEYDHLPLAEGFMDLQIEEMKGEGADVMAHHLERVDRTSSPFALAHDSDPGFVHFLKSVSRRPDPGVLLWMFGSGSLWKREAFLVTASLLPPTRCYFELALPTVAHHLGFRIRRWNAARHMVTNLPSGNVSVTSAGQRGCLTVHPIKKMPAKAFSKQEGES